jgi:HD-GYP domain-containing protein (c-di-GMP phosphodiesterase class II)
MGGLRDRAATSSTPSITGSCRWKKPNLSAVDRLQDDSGLRLAEVLATLSLATDLGLGQPMEHILRSCLIAVRLGERIGLDEDERAALYYVALLAWVGCMVDSHEVAKWFGDDIEFKADLYDIDTAGLPMLAFMLRHAGAGSTPSRRARVAATLLVTGGRPVGAVMMAQCQATGALADRLGLGPEVRVPLQHNFARWDGKGLPEGLAGEDIALPMRIVHLAEIVEVFHRREGVDAAVDVARTRAGRSFDPAIVSDFCRVAPEVLGDLDRDTNWDALIEGEPALRPRLTERELDNALEAIADFVDLRSPFFAGHSRGVADLAAGAARDSGLAEEDVATLRRAALLHDLGRTGVPNTIWEKPGPLTGAEWERVRLHSYYVERMLARPPALARLAAIASFDHERLDGSGYHRGASGGSLTAAVRLLGAADAYHAMREERPYRPALSPEESAAELRADAGAGRLDAEAVEMVLGSAGHRVRRRRKGPGGLTPRETDVLVCMARGMSNREAAGALHISQKTVGNHVEHIYTKLGISTRTAAALFAMQHGLVDPLEPSDAVTP